MLNETETKIMLDVYAMDINNESEINENNYQLEESEPRAKKQEFAWYLFKLIRLGYLSVDNINKTFLKGGFTHQKYNNNVIMIWYKDVHITNKGIEYVNKIIDTLNNELNSSKEDKKRDKSKRKNVKAMGEALYKEVKDWGTDAIAKYFAEITKIQ